MAPDAVGVDERFGVFIEGERRSVRRGVVARRRASSQSKKRNQEGNARCEESSGKRRPASMKSMHVHYPATRAVKECINSAEGMWRVQIPAARRYRARTRPS